jgi:hypothetical protein
MMVNAEQSHVVWIRQSAVDPFAHVMALAVLRRMRAAGKGAAGVAGDQRQATSVCDRLAIRRLRPKSNTAPEAVNTVGMISALLANCSNLAVDSTVPSVVRPDPTRLVRSSASTVTITVTGNPPSIRNVTDPQLPVTAILRRIMAALPIRPGIDLAGRIDPRFRQRLEQGF